MKLRSVASLTFSAYMLTMACSGCLGGSMAVSDGRMSLAESDPGYDSMRNRGDEQQSGGDGILKLLAAIMLVGGLGSLATMRLTRQFEKDETGLDPHQLTSPDSEAARSSSDDGRNV